MSSLAQSVQRLAQSQKSLADFESYLAIALGLVKNAVPEVKFGHCPAAGTTVTDVWELGGTQPTYIFPLDTGEDLEAVSSDNADTVVITLTGLNQDGYEKSVSFNLTGLAAVAIPGPDEGGTGKWRSVTRAFNGDSVDLAGQVTIRGTGLGGSTSNIFAFIDTDDQQTSQTVYVVPVDKVAIMNNISNAVNKTGGPTLSCVYALKVAKPNKVFRTQIRYGLMREGTSNISSDLIIPILVGPLSKMKVTAEPTNTDTDVSSEYSMILVDKDSVPADVLASL